MCNVAELIIFYDGTCPLCATEMRHLHQCDREGVICFENIYADDFAQRYPAINREKADRILHAQRRNGEILLGLDVTYHAWALVGKRRWVAPLRWPVIKPLADALYLFFARYRHPISRLLMGSRKTPRCEWQPKR